MENTRQRKHLYKQAGIWLVALFVVLTAAFMRGKVNVKAAETDDITITRYVDGREQTDSWTGGEWEYTVGDSINLSVKVEGISDTTNLKYKWRYAGKVVSESTGGTESSVTITKECGEDSPDCVISNGDEEIDTVWFTLETTETLEVFRPTLFIDGEKAPETNEDDGNSEYSWDDSINLQLGQELKIKLNVESSYDAKNISYEWYQQDEDGWYNDKISDENGGNTDAVTVKKQKYGKERYRCEVTDGNQKEDLYITIPEVKTLSVIKKVNGEVYKSGMEGIRGKKYTLKVDAESVYKDENGKTNITYKWYQGYDEENIQGKTDTLEIELDSEGASYACEVSDGNSVKECYFSIDLKNTLSWSICTVVFNGQEYFSGSAQLLEIPRGTELKLRNLATSTLGEVDFQWYDSHKNPVPDEQGGKTSTITIKKSTQGEETYYCKVTDGNIEKESEITLGAEDTLDFSTKINGKYNNSSDEEPFTMKKGEKATLSVVDVKTTYDNAKITYQWYEGSEDLLEGENGPNLTVTKKAGYEEYTCKVSDGNVTHQTYFVLDIESGLEWTSYINGKQAERDEDGLLDASIEAETGDKILMEVKAESSYGDSTLSYQWYKDDKKIKEATQSSYTATKQAATEYYAEEGVNDENYYCKISDGYTSDTCYFTLRTKKTLSIKAFINGANTSKLETAAAGGKYVLKADSSSTHKNSNITCKWYQEGEEGWNRVCDESGNMVTTPELAITKNGTKREDWKVEVTDGNDIEQMTFSLADTEHCEHKWSIDDIEDATCTKDGKKMYSCEYCYKQKTEKIPALGHEWDEGTVTKQPSVTEEGIRTYKCKHSGCKETKTEKIAKLPKPEQPSTEKPGTGETKPSGDNKTPVTSDNNAGTAKQTLKPGTKIVDKKTKAAYKVMANNTVQYTKVTSKKAKIVKVPSTITVNGVKCQVTSIAPKAMKGNKKLTKVVIPASVRTIGAQAFAGCKNLKNITIQTPYLTKKSVGAKAFKGISDKAVIKVPKKQLKVYQKLLKTKGVSKKVKIKK
ncbi:MAG: leucine-rich repeat protein [Anaerobutyricum soehngenii]